MRHAASSTTSDQPTPMSSRLPPVMLARASGAYFSGFSPAFAGEREVDGVLGQHRDQREHGEGEALRHVELERLGRPGEQERRADDGEAEHDGPPTSPRVGAREPRPAPGSGERARPAPIASTGPGRPRRRVGVLSGAVGVTRPILREAFPGLRPPRGRHPTDARIRRMNSQEPGRTAEVDGCWMRFYRPLPGPEHRRHETG